MELKMTLSPKYRSRCGAWTFPATWIVPVLTAQQRPTAIQPMRYTDIIELQILCVVLHFLFENCFPKAILRFMDIYMNETDKERNETP
jgi:hypothetical protein